MPNNPGTSTYQNLRDQNRVTIASGQSNADSTQSLPFLIDHVTGRLLVASTGGGSGAALVETPGGSIDGVNTVYTTTNQIGTVLNLFYNGGEIHPAEYTVSGSGFTMGTALPVIPGAAFTIVYQGTSLIPTGVGINPQNPTSGAINNSNKVFVFAAAPTAVVVNGQIYFNGAGYSLSGTTVTLDNVVGTGGSIKSLG